MTTAAARSRICRVSHRLFTPVQANRTLPLVRRIVADILACAREVRSTGGSLGADRLAELQTEIERLIRELEALGCLYKDWGFEAGLVDFPSKIEGRRVLLCWRSDEESVLWYHGAEDGFAGRRPIPAHLLDDPVASEVRS